MDFEEGVFAVIGGLVGLEDKVFWELSIACVGASVGLGTEVEGGRVGVADSVLGEGCEDEAITEKSDGVPTKENIIAKTNMLIATFHTNKVCCEGWDTYP
jgi:hypothetical protein